VSAVCCVINFRFFVFFRYFLLLLSMEREPVVNAPEAGPTAYAAYRDASLSQLEGFMAEARALTTERIALGNTATERKRKEAIAERLGDLKGHLDAIRLCLDGEDYIRARRDGMAIPVPSAHTGEAPVKKNHKDSMCLHLNSLNLSQICIPISINLKMSIN
jgi:hypothetical protein